MTNDQLQVDPLLFFVPAMTIFALGLFFLRLFPLLLKLFSLLGGKWLSVPLYLTLTQLARSAKAYYPLMILLILTLGLGVYNSSAARTIDLNSTEQLLYRYGSDVIVKTVWEGIQRQPAHGSAERRRRGRRRRAAEQSGQSGQSRRSWFPRRPAVTTAADVLP